MPNYDPDYLYFRAQSENISDRKPEMSDFDKSNLPGSASRNDPGIRGDIEAFIIGVLLYLFIKRMWHHKIASLVFIAAGYSAWHLLVFSGGGSNINPLAYPLLIITLISALRIIFGGNENSRIYRIGGESYKDMDRR